ncbi:acyltransferase [Bhargavaea ullalensis]|uniref:Peptidoglycan/LPS O-acetylase OafA/YrhL n=1 Tax=Bhargavaea ullalensis TaxID=1265685 RepID=A0ABV2GAT8_9BACL
MKKERIESLKYMRVVAMSLVVLIHTTGVAFFHVPTDSPLYQVYLFLNRFTRFEGSVFVFLSGMLLFYNYEEKPFTAKTWLGFYRRRFLYILAPYIVWSVFYEWFGHAMGYRNFDGIGQLFSDLLDGGANYQLYFIMILVQLYFLMPVFVYLVRKVPFVRKWLFLLGFLAELIYQVLNRTYGWIDFPFFMVYLASFLMGGWTGIHYQKLKNPWSAGKYLAVSAATFVIGILYMELYLKHNILKEPVMPYAPFKFIAMFYYLLACYLLFKLGIRLEQVASERIRNGAEQLRIYSFGFYLVHPFLLYLWEMWLPSEGGWTFHALIFLRYVLVMASCYGLIRAVHLVFPGAWFIFGKLPSPARTTEK